VSTTRGPRRTVTFVYVMAGWLGISVLAYLFVLPLLSVSARSDRLAGGGRRERAAMSQVRVPSPQRVGYAGMVLDRLAQHTRTVLGFEQAWILVNARARVDRWPRWRGPASTLT
jgi:hypothetical protein